MVIAIKIAQIHQALGLEVLLGHVVEHRLERCATATVRGELHLVVGRENIDVVHFGVAVDDVDFGRAYSLHERTDFAAEGLQVRREVLGDSGGWAGPSCNRPCWSAS